MSQWSPQRSQQWSPRISQQWSPQRSQSDVPHHIWGQIADPFLRQKIVSIQDRQLQENADVAETARLTLGWSSDGSGFTSSDRGFHPGFLRNTSERTVVRSRLIEMIKDAIAALERCCGAACIATVFYGETNPQFNDIAARDLVGLPKFERNIHTMYSDIFRIKEEVFMESIQDIMNICRYQIGVQYVRDFRRRAAHSRYFRDPLIEALEPTQSAISTTPSTNSSDSSEGEDDAAPVTPSHIGSSDPHFPILHPAASVSQPPAPYQPDELSTDIKSSFRSLNANLEAYHRSFLETIGTPSAPQRQPRAPSPTDTLVSSASALPVSQPRDIPPLVLELLENFRGHHQDARIGTIRLVHAYIPRELREEALRDSGFNEGTAKALVYLMDQ
ncbi:hypothetical protein BC834DRAFT_282653 [Gloeopeniophorella convolvens]|nr:hypothetical protein BC834DRAFT_282653 [Gloeopeniophorella convolvens]